MGAAVEAIRVLRAVEAGDPASVLDRGDPASFRRLARLLHPDRAVANGIDTDRATAAFATAKAWWDGVRPRTGKSSTAGSTRGPVTMTSRRSTYTLGVKIADGTVASVYAATDADGHPVAVKVYRSPTSAALATAERDALTTMADTVADQPILAGLYPELLDSFKHKDSATGQVRRVNVLEPLHDGWHTLADVARAYPGGLDGRDWAWMMRRLLNAVGGVGLAGLVHTAVLPENVLVHAGHHGLVLAGFSLAVPEGVAPAGLVADHLGDYPPEARDKRPLDASTDLFMAGRLAAAMLAPAERAQRAFATGIAQPTPRARPDVASAVVEYDELVRRLYGPRRFRPFTMPAKTTD